MALLVLVHAWTRGNPRRLQSWFARLAMACGEDSLFIYSSILVLDVLANLLLTVTHGGVLLQTELTICGLSLLCGMAWWRRGHTLPRVAGSPVRAARSQAARNDISSFF